MINIIRAATILLYIYIYTYIYTHHTICLVMCHIYPIGEREKETLREREKESRKEPYLIFLLDSQSMYK